MKAGNITPFSAHRQHLREDLDRVKSSGQALIVTTNGKPDAVVLSPEHYDRLMDADELLKSLKVIDKSQSDIREGRTQPLRDALRDMAQDFGIGLDR